MVAVDGDENFESTVQYWPVVYDTEIRQSGFRRFGHRWSKFLSYSVVYNTRIFAIWTRDLDAILMHAPQSGVGDLLFASCVFCKMVRNSRREVCSIQHARLLRASAGCVAQRPKVRDMYFLLLSPERIALCPHAVSRQPSHLLQLADECLTVKRAVLRTTATIVEENYFFRG